MNNFSFRLHALSAVALATTMTNAVSAAAQDYPTKPVRLVTGFAAGGSADASARGASTKMGELLKNSFVVENRGGAGGSVAAQIVANASPDGYTLLWGSVGALTVNPVLEPNLPYRTTSFTPVGLAVTFSNALIVRPDFAAGSLKELIALAKDKPGQFSIATQGLGSAGQLSGGLLTQATGVRFLQIPYKGAVEILTSLVGGDVQLAFVSITGARSLPNGRVKILAVTGAVRDPALPDIPTFGEAGVKGYDATFWYGLLAPARTPAPIVSRLNEALRTALEDPVVAKPLLAQGLNPAPSTPEQYGVLLRRDYDKWKKVIEDNRGS